MARAAIQCGWIALALGAYLAILAATAGATNDEHPEYRIKAALIYNFVAFTEWPADTGDKLNLCLFGPNPFGAEIGALEGKKAGARSLTVRHDATLDSLTQCQIVFVSHGAIKELPQVLEHLRGVAALTVTDTPGAARDGAILNMQLAEDRVGFEANLAAARAARLALSAHLLRLATGVIQ